jgi:hypothetical protein
MQEELAGELVGQITLQASRRLVLCLGVALQLTGHTAPSGNTAGVVVGKRSDEEA